MLTFKIWLAVLTSSLLPFLSIAWLWKKKARNRWDWALTFSLAGALSLLTFIATPWAFTSYYLRYLLVVLFALAAYFSFKKIKDTHHKTPSSVGDRVTSAGKVILLLVLLSLDIVAISSYFYSSPSVELAFPFSNGVYYVIQGGNSVITSPFHRSGTNNKEDYAMDIVKLNWAGNRAAGIYPRELSSYAVFGETVYSPCNGEVIEVFDGVPDNPIGDEGHQPSNHIVIRCQGARVTLAHMTSGSLLIRHRQSLEEGQPLGRVGNAGHTSEPHLHIDAVRDVPDSIEPLPISFNRKMLSLNSIVMR